jgi:hypothetical protein
MIHLTVAAPLGIDSIFFSFIQRMAQENGHECLDPPALQMDPRDDGAWIDDLRAQSKHHFLIGYRYPPACWKRLVEASSTVILLADPDGIDRQVEQLRLQSVEDGGTGDLPSVVEGLSEAFEAMIALTQWILSGASIGNRLIPPASAILNHPSEAFRRFEDFYRQAGVSMSTRCGDQFSMEALPFLQSKGTIPKTKVVDIQRLLTLNDVTPERIQAVAMIFTPSH